MGITPATKVIHCKFYILEMRFSRPDKTVRKKGLRYRENDTQQICGRPNVQQIWHASSASSDVLHTDGSVSNLRPGVASHAREPSKNSVPSHWSQNLTTTTRHLGCYCN